MPEAVIVLASVRFGTNLTRADKADREDELVSRRSLPTRAALGEYN